MKKNELKPCPFCGSKAEMRKGEISDIVQISCSRCGVATQRLTYNVPMPDGKVITEEMAMKNLAWIWNRRVSEE